MLEDSFALQVLTGAGYFAVLAGSGIQNSTTLLLAGYLAQRGYFSLALVMFCALTGSALAGQGLFYLSRRKGARVFVKFPKAAARADALCRRVSEMPRALEWFTLVFRWCYGVKNVSPLFLGRTAISGARFLLLNLLGAAFWAAVMSMAGFGLGEYFQDAIGSTLKYELLLLLVMIALPAAIAALRLRSASRKKPDGPGRR